MHTSTEKLIHFTKVKANRIAKETMAGPGKFGVFIFFCILIVGLHDGFNIKKEDECNPIKYNCKCLPIMQRIENKENLKEIFPQTFNSNPEEKKTKKMAYLNIIKRNQSIKENESYENELNYILDLTIEQTERERFLENENEIFEDL